MRPSELANFVVMPRMERFGAGMESRFFARLQKQRRATAIVELRSPRLAMLDQRGYMQGKFRLSYRALTKLCTDLAPGLSQLVVSLIEPMRQDVKHVATSPDLAVQLVNELISLRFKDRLAGSRLILDLSDNRVEGIVGPAYQLASNYELAQRAKQFVQKMDPNAVFHESVLVGRRMMVCYLSCQPAFRLEVEQGFPDPYRQGFHFSNSEVGDSAVRAGVALVREWDGGRALHLFEQTGKAIHRGEQFAKKVAQMFEAGKRKTFASAELQQYARERASEVVTIYGDSERAAKRRLDLVRKLQRHGVTRKLSERVVLRASQLGNTAAKGQTVPDPKRAGSIRTSYDVFTSLALCSRSQAIEFQETLAQLAFRVLIGKFSLT